MVLGSALVVSLEYICRANTGVVLSLEVPVEGRSAELPLGLSLGSKTGRSLWVEREALDVWFGVENGNAKLCDSWRASRQTGNYFGG